MSILSISITFFAEAQGQDAEKMMSKINERMIIVKTL